jgi:hypothetical protein
MKKLFMNPNLNLNDVRELLPNRTRSYQERKLEQIHSCLGNPVLQDSPPSKQNNLAEIEAKMRDGLKEARRAVGDDQVLSVLIDSLEDMWEGLRDQFLVVSVGLCAMRYRTDEQITQQLTDYKARLDQIATSDSWSVSGIVGNA